MPKKSFPPPIPQLKSERKFKTSVQKMKVVCKSCLQKLFGKSLIAKFVFAKFVFAKAVFAKLCLQKFVFAQVRVCKGCVDKVVCLKFVL